MPEETKDANRNEDVSAWKELFVPEPVLDALRDLGFKEPTPIQRQTLPAAIKGRRDIIGAAETGSGKNSDEIKIQHQAKLCLILHDASIIAPLCITLL